MKKLTSLLALLLAVFFTACSNSSDSIRLKFAKTTFESLIRGDSDVSEHIDWETLSSFGAPVGAQYLALDSEEARETFKTGFVTQFSTSFRNSGGSINDFNDWRITKSDPNFSEVTADSATGSLILTITKRDDKIHLSALNIVR